MPGSSSSTDPTGHVLVGVVGRAHGLAGNVFVLSESDDPQRFRAGSRVFLDGRPIVVETTRHTDGRLIVKLEGVGDRTAAEAIRNGRLTVPETERRSLGPDEWWPDQLVGLRVLDHVGVERGVVEEVVEGVAQDRLAVLTAAGAVVEVPFVTALVPLVDIAGGFVQLSDVEGLLTEP